MPHLTPMSWITALFFIWMLISTMNMIQWSTKPMKFISMSNNSKSLMIKSWSWNLQDGR